jgi:DNA-binding MarR family transcriptional regulator
MKNRTLVTELILETFRLNGDLLAAGDDLVRDLGLTSARWQVLGAIAGSPVPLPVAHIARNMGLTRQSVQRLANELAGHGIVRFAPNPNHERAKLVLLTKAGERAFAEAMARQAPWADELGKGLAPHEIEAASRVLRVMRQRLESKEVQSGGSNERRES